MKKTKFESLCIFAMGVFAIFFISGCATKQDFNIKDASQEDGIAVQDPEIYNEFENFLYKENISNILKLMEKHTGKRTGGDCSGFVSFLNNANGHIYFENSDLHRYVTKGAGKANAMYNLYKARDKISFENPKAGDLVFFANTTKKTKNKKNKIITHIGVIKNIYKDGRVSFVHNIRGKNKIDYMNLNKKNIYKNNKIIENSYIIRCSNSNPSCLTSNRFAGYGKISH